MATPTFVSPIKASDMSYVSTESTAIPLPPMEEGIAKMERILVKAKIIPYTTASEASRAFWSDDSFYKKWLLSRENTEISMSDWEEAAEGETIEYRGETFEKKRTLTFKSARTLSSVTSPAKDPSKVLVNVEEIQYYRTEEDRVIVATQVKQTNIPFGESFSVHWRWVATDIKPKKIVIRVGFLIEFHTAVMVADKLRKQQGNFSAQRHSHLFRTMKDEIASRQVVLAMKDPMHKVVTALRVFFPFWAPQKRVNSIPRMVGKVLEQLRLIELLPPPTEKTNDVKTSLKQLKAVQETVKALVDREKAWVISTLPEGLEAEDCHEDLPSFLVPIAKACDKLHVINPFEKHSMKHVLSESDNTVIVLPYADTVLERMTLVASKTIYDCPTEDVMNFMTVSDKAWYEAWVAESGRSEVEVPAWTSSSEDEGTGVKDEYSGETFSHSRTVTCRFEKSIYNKKVDPSSAAVKAKQTQVQCCRFDTESSAFIWTTTTTVQGNAFADSWRAHVRWVVSPVEENAIQVKIGYSIELLKPVIVETQLRATALATVKERQIKLLTVFRENLKAAVAARKRKHPVIETVESSVSGAVNQVQRWLRLYPEDMLRDEPTWQPIFLDIRKKLGLLEQTLRHTGRKMDKTAVQQEARDIFIELEKVKTELEGIMQTMSDSGVSERNLDEDITKKLILE